MTPRFRERKNWRILTPTFDVLEGRLRQLWTPLFSFVRFITATLLPLFVCHDFQQVLELVLRIFNSAVTSLRPRGVEPRLVCYIKLNFLHIFNLS